MIKGLVSIIIPTFNRAHIISEALDSIVKQTYTHWECIVVDDGSKDDTESLIKRYAENDSRFQFYHRPKQRIKGANACRNFGFEKSKGEFINWFDSDDFMHPDFIKKRLDYLKNDPSLDFCACLGRKFVKGIDIDGLTIKPQVLNSENYLEDYLLNGLFFYTPSPLWRKRFLISKDLFDEKMQRAQESDFHFRMLTYKLNYQYLEEALFYIRMGKESITKNAHSSYIAQASVFYYFDSVFNFFNTNKALKNSEKLMKYVFYRQAVNYYNLNQLQSNILGRFIVLFKYSGQLINYAFRVRSLRSYLIKILIGLGLVFIFKKGYKFFYFPQYDCRKHIKRKIMHKQQDAI